MHSHYQTLGVAKSATTEEITRAYRNTLGDVLPKYSLYPTSPKTIENFRKVQEAYECLIDVDRRKSYDAELDELEAEERSLFGERRERRLAEEAERRKAQNAPPPYVWNEDTNAPLFWTPGLKLIEGPKDDTEKPKPVAYYKRASLDSQLVLVSRDPPPPPKAAPLPSKSNIPPPTKNEPTPPPKYTPLQVSTSPISPISIGLPKPQSLHSVQAVPYFSQKYHSAVPVWTQASVEYIMLQKAREEERHKRQVYIERERAAKELEKVKRKVERTVYAEMEARRQLLEKERERAAREAERLRIKQERERELVAKEAERLRLKQEKEQAKQQKKVRWGVDHIDLPPPAKMHFVDTGPYDAWYQGYEQTNTRPNVLLKKRRN